MRPARCPWCGAASRVHGAGLGLHGHGLVDRQQWGPTEIGGKAELIVLRVRRFVCTGCNGVCSVVPRGVVAGLYYSAFAIGMALALWGVCKEAAPQVRRQVSPFEHVGHAAARGWASLGRWTRGIGAGRWLDVGRLAVGAALRDEAAAIATVLAGHAPPGDRAAGFPSRAGLGAVQWGVMA